MPATLKIDQTGLPAGSPGISRDDGLDTGALVTLTNTGGGATLHVNLLWVPPEDIGSPTSIVQTSPTTFTYSPTPATYGRHRIEMIVDQGLQTESRTIHTFGIALPLSGLIIPAANELADPSTNRQNAAEASRLEASESNAPFLPFLLRQPFGWWKALRDLIVFAEASGGGASPGIRHHLVSGVNLVVQPTFEYLVQGPLTIDAGASLMLSGADARLSVI